MTVKVIAVKTINKTPPGGELEVSAPVAEVLVRLGNARYADEQARPAPPLVARPRGRPRRSPEGSAVGATTTQGTLKD